MLLDGKNYLTGYHALSSSISHGWNWTRQPNQMNFLQVAFEKWMAVSQFPFLSWSVLNLEKLSAAFSSFLLVLVSPEVLCWIEANRFFAHQLTESRLRLSLTIRFVPAMQGVLFQGLGQENFSKIPNQLNRTGRSSHLCTTPSGCNSLICVFDVVDCWPRGEAVVICDPSLPWGLQHRSRCRQHSEKGTRVFSIFLAQSLPVSPSLVSDLWGWWIHAGGRERREFSFWRQKENGPHSILVWIRGLSSYLLNSVLISGKKLREHLDALKLVIALQSVRVPTNWA